MTEEAKRGRGRPRKHNDAQSRQRAWRDRTREHRTRLDLYVSYSVSWRIKKLAVAWGCSPAEVIERLTAEADDRYSDILFPET